MTVRTLPGDANSAQLEWPLITSVAEGIVNDLTGDAFDLTPSGSAPEVTVAAGAGLAAGFVVDFDGDLTEGVLDLSSVPGATEPAAGQKRVDLVVLRYDWSAAAVDLDTAGTLAVRAGTPAATTVSDADAAPSPQRDVGVIWEVPLWRVSRPFGGVVTSTLDLRSWTGPTLHVPTVAPLPTGVPLGTTLLRAGGDVPDLLRGLSSGSAAWLERQLVAGAPIRSQSVADVTAGAETRELFNIPLTGIERGLVDGNVLVPITAASRRAGTISTRVGSAPDVIQHRWDLPLQSGPAVPLTIPFKVTNPGDGSSLRVFIQSSSGVYRYIRPSLTIWRHSVRWT